MPTRKDVHNSEIPRLCLSCEARHRGICGALSADELLALSKHTHKARHRSGSELIGESEAVSSYSNVMRGVVKLSKMLEDGRQQVVGLQFAPDFLGRLYAQESVLAAEAASDVETCSFPKAALENLVKYNSQLEHVLLNQTLRELDEARDWMVTLGRKTAAEKVASLIYLIATHLEPAIEDDALNSTQFDLPLTRADIADFLGLTVETVSRQLTKLRTDKTIEISNNRTIMIPDIARLKGRCG